MMLACLEPFVLLWVNQNANYNFTMSKLKAPKVLNFHPLYKICFPKGQHFGSETTGRKLNISAWVTWNHPENLFLSSPNYGFLTIFVIMHPLKGSELRRDQPKHVQRGIESLAKPRAVDIDARAWGGSFFFLSFFFFTFLDR